jgi:hypothetical protein
MGRLARVSRVASTTISFLSNATFVWSQVLQFGNVMELRGDVMFLFVAADIAQPGEY